MFTHIRSAILMFLALTVITGIIYPLLVTGAAHVLFPWQAEGSLLVRDGQTVGAALVGQSFTDPKYFWGRPSATSPAPYDASSSQGSNLGPTNPDLVQAVRQRVLALREADPGNQTPIPVDLVTASASGLDPHISPAAAAFQVARVARARKLDEQAIRDVVARHTERRTAGLLGEPRVNVLQLNLALDEEFRAGTMTRGQLELISRLR
jgi:potassium-transporting ATPase KdpC subunit